MPDPGTAEGMKGSTENADRKTERMEAMERTAVRMEDAKKQLSAARHCLHPGHQRATAWLVGQGPYKI